MGIQYHELWVRWKAAQDAGAREELTERYLWLVRYVAGRLMVGLPAQFDQHDVEGHGCFGLLEAINRFEPERGIRFETYAIPWIRGACLQGIRMQQWAPALRKRVLALDRAQLELTERLGRAPTHEELAGALGLKPAELQQRIAEAGCLSVLSLDEVYDAEDGDGASLQERLASDAYPDPTVSVLDADRRDLLARAIESLPGQERMVVSLFYYEGLTAKEISEVLSLSQARISQLHSTAIMRLRGKLSRLKATLVS